MALLCFSLHQDILISKAQYLDLKFELLPKVGKLVSVQVVVAQLTLLDLLLVVDHLMLLNLQSVDQLMQVFVVLNLSFLKSLVELNFVLD